MGCWQIMQFRVLEPLHYQQQVLQSILLGACNVLRIYSSLKKYVLKQQSFYFKDNYGVGLIDCKHAFLTISSALTLRGNNEVKVDLDYRKKGIEGVEGVRFQNRCVYDVGNGNIS